MDDDNKDLDAEMKAWLEALSTDLTKRMDKVQECLININNYLIAMEHSGYSTTKEDADVAAPAKAKPNHNDIAKALEDNTKYAMDATRRTFLKDKMESSKSLVISKIVEHVMNNLFITKPRPEVPTKMPLPTTTSSSHHKTRILPIIQPYYHNNGKEEPLPWLNHCE